MKNSKGLVDMFSRLVINKVSLSLLIKIHWDHLKQIHSYNYVFEIILIII